MRVKPSKPIVLMVLLLAGCTVAVTPPTGGERQPAPRARASVKRLPADAANASPAPAALASSAAPGGASAIAATVPLAAMQIPTRILPELPASLVGTDGASLIGPDGASLIGPDGASLVGPDGASLIGPDGASLIGPDGASYVLAQVASPSPAATASADATTSPEASASPAVTATASPAATASASASPSPEPTCTPPGIPLIPGQLIKAEFQDFVMTCRSVEMMLGIAAKLKLQPGVPQTIKKPGLLGKEQAQTYLLEARGTGGLLTVAEGETITPENTIVSVAFKSADVGEAVYRFKQEMLGITIGMRVVFDHVQGKVESDSVAKLKPFGPAMTGQGDKPQLGRRQVHVTKLTGGGPDVPTLRLASASVTNQGDGVCGDSRVMTAIHYLPDGRAAMQVAEANTPGVPLVYLGLDGVRAAEPGPGTGFFVDNDKDGGYLAGDVTLRQLGPAMPTKAHMPAGLPVLPDIENPLADPIFAPLK